MWVEGYKVVWGVYNRVFRIDVWFCKNILNEVGVF